MRKPFTRFLSCLAVLLAGMIRSCDLVKKWKLRKSDYALYGY